MNKLLYLVVDEAFQIIGSFLSDNAVNYLDDIEETVLEKLGVKRSDKVHVLQVGQVNHALTVEPSEDKPEESPAPKKVAGK